MDLRPAVDLWESGLASISAVFTSRQRKRRIRTERWIFRSGVGLAAITLLALATPLGVGVSAASGSTNPPFEPDANTAPPYGNLVFYDANGNQVTSGTNLNTPFAYAVATTGADANATKAIVNYQPRAATYGPERLPRDLRERHDRLQPGLEPTGGDTLRPCGLRAGHPVAAMAGTGSIPVWIASNSPSTTAGYADTIQVRLTDSGARGAGNAAGTYWASDIGYNTTASPITVDGTTVPADGWAQLFPLVTPTTTTLTATPASPKVAGTTVTLKATVAPAEAGTVQFYDGTTAVGAPVTVSAGKASTAVVPALGAHSFTAVFIPTLGDETGANTTSATIVGGSTSNAVAYTIDAAPTLTSVSPSLLAAGSKGTFTLAGTGFAKGAKLKLTATGVTVSKLTVKSATSITATFTATTTAAPGTYNATVTNSDGGTATCTSCFTVVVAPTLTAISPASAAQGAIVTGVKITGTGFSNTDKSTPKVTGPTGVTFSKVTVKSATQITATMTVSATAPTGSNLAVTVTMGAKAGAGVATGDVLTIT